MSICVYSIIIIIIIIIKMNENRKKIDKKKTGEDR